MATELPPGHSQAKETTRISILFPTKTMTNFQRLHLFPLERAFCNILDVQKGNASFEHIWNPCWGSVVLLGSHPWIGVVCPQGIAKPRNRIAIIKVQAVLVQLACAQESAFGPHTFPNLIACPVPPRFRKGVFFSSSPCAPALSRN